MGRVPKRAFNIGTVTTLAIFGGRVGPEIEGISLYSVAKSFKTLGISRDELGTGVALHLKAE